MRLDKLGSIFLMAIAFVGFAPNVASAVSANFSATKASSEGSVYEAEFKEILDDLIARLRRAYIQELDATSRLIEERQIIEQMKVTFLEKKDLFVTIDGVMKQVDALNYPVLKLIEVDSRRWILLDKKQREHLVLHEVYGLLGWERNTYDSSERDLGFLYGKENPQSRADECPLGLLGTHAGDRCLWVLLDVQEQEIEGLQEALLTFTVPREKDNEHLAGYRARIKKLIEKQKAEVESEGPDFCDLQVTSEGNNGAYDRSLCVLEAWDHVLKLLRKLYNEIKAIDPNLPALAPVTSRIG